MVLGAAGQVGRALVERGGAALRGFDRAACDICDKSSVSQALGIADLSLVVNCAAYTAVDRAESESDLAMATNQRGAAVVAEVATLRGVPVIHLSTDYVYSGRGEAALRETEAVRPLNCYGASKAAGDMGVAAANPKHIILRVSWVFGTSGTNFVKTMLRLARERNEMRIVDDQIGGPTEARDIADAILGIAGPVSVPDFASWGVYHYAGAPFTSWHDFAQEIFRLSTGPKPGIVPIVTADYPSAARRPLNSRLDSAKFEQKFGIRAPDWRASLARVVKTIEAETR